MPVDVVITPPLWTDMHESELKLKMRVRRIKDGRDLRGGFTAFSSCFPDVCESKTSCVLPLSLSQPCLPVANLGPTRVLPHLYLGSQKDVLNKELMAQNGITYVLNASNTCPKPDFISESHFLRVPVNDSYCEQLLPWLEKTNEFIDKAKVSNCRVMVHCLAGISRSATIAIAYIMKTMGLSSDDAYRFVKDRRPSISPNFNFLGQLLEFERELKLKMSMTCNLLRSTPSQYEGTETVEGSKGKNLQRARESMAVNVMPPSPTSLQRDFSSLHLSTKQIIHSRQLRCSLNLNIKSVNSLNQQPNTSGSNLDPMPKLFKISSPKSSECVYSCQEPKSPDTAQTRPSLESKQTNSRPCERVTSTSLSLNLNLNRRGLAAQVPNPTVKSSLFLSLPLTTSSTWTKHRGMNHATTPVTPSEDHSWIFNSDLDRSPRFANSHNSSVIKVEKQFKKRSCQFEDSIVTAHTSEDFGKLGKQSNFSGSMEVIEVS